MQAKSGIKLAVYIVLVAIVGYIAIAGLQIGIYDVKPIGNQIKRGLDLTGGVYTVYQAPDKTIEDYEYKMQGAVTVLRSRLDSKGYTEATISRQGDDKIRIEIPINETSADQDVNEISQFIGTPAKLQFKDPDGNVVVEGAQIQSARAVTSSEKSGQYAVSFKMDSTGAEAFGKATSANIGKQISITLDDKVISSPKVDNAIMGGEGQITGTFTLEEAQNLAMQIESGALPIDLKEIEVRSIDATLGSDALSSSVLAGAVGVGLVMLFMLFVYRMFGLAADLALCSYILILLLLLALFEVQLTLAGFAGIILGIGMAVDANVVIFERVKEEMRVGKSLSAAIDSGFKRATSAIADSNITTLIAAIVLWMFGTGSIKGFAITLTLSILVSLFSAVVITKFLMRIFMRLGCTKPGLYYREVKSA